VYEGYCSDITRVACVGRASDEARAVYEIVYEAHMRARETAKPGVPAREVDRAARAVIEKAGYGDYFVHRTGHGIGLSIHEPPYLAQTYDGVLEVGHCFTIEPGHLPAGQVRRAHRECLHCHRARLRIAERRTAHADSRD
jgi:Xaa-Pro dipeptidase